MIGQRAVEITVAKNDGPSFDGGPYLFDEVLPSAGGIKQSFGAGIHRRVPFVEDDVADLLGDRGSARLPGDDGFFTFFVEVLLLNCFAMIKYPLLEILDSVCLPYHAALTDKDVNIFRL